MLVVLIGNVMLIKIIVIMNFFVLGERIKEEEMFVNLLTIVVIIRKILIIIVHYLNGKGVEG